MSTTSDKNVKDGLQQLFEARLHRRQALKLMAGTAATSTLVACGVSPAPTPKPETRTNTVVLRAKTKDLSDRDRLRAIAAYVNPANRTRVDILGEYWLTSKPVVYGKPGAEFLGQGMDIVVIAKGKSAAAVREWAAQWSDVLDFDSDEAEPVGPVRAPQGGSQDEAPSFLVFERVAGAVPREKVLETDPGIVHIVSHHVLVNDFHRQILVVRAPSREAVRRWVNLWGSRRSVEVLELTSLSRQLLTRPQAAISAALPVMSRAAIIPADYHPGGQSVVGDLRPGAWFLRNEATGHYLSVDSSGRVITVLTPSPGDRWITIPYGGLDSNDARGYSLQHQGTLRYLSGEVLGNVSSSTSPQSWKTGLVGELTYGITDSTGWTVLAVLSEDSKGVLTTVPPPYLTGAHSPSVNWQQWGDYNHPTQPEQAVTNLVTTTASDQPWPEDSYTGDELAAYNDLIRMIGALPRKGNVSSQDVDDALEKVPKPVPPIYAAVAAHLKDEISYLEKLDQWYGDGGHVSTLLSETTLDNLTIIGTVKGKVSLPPDNSPLNFVLGTLFTAFSLGFAAAGAGPVVGALIAGVWRMYSAYPKGGATNILNSTFGNLETDLRHTFDALITQREDTRSAIANNWGKLKTFAELVKGSEFVWPDNTDAIRVAAEKIFEISVWQSVAKAIWVYGGEADFYPGDRNQGPNFELSSAWDYLVQAPGEHIECHKEVSGWFNDLITLPDTLRVPESLAKYLFDDSPGNLGISMTDFYMGRNGWGMENDQSHTSAG